MANVTWELTLLIWLQMILLFLQNDFLQSTLYLRTVLPKPGGFLFSAKSI